MIHTEYLGTNKTNQILDGLVKSGSISHYEYCTVYEDNRCRDIHSQERLILYFPRGDKLVIDIVNSGCLDNLSLIFS